MLTNDILRRVRYALNISDKQVREMFALAGIPIGDELLKTMFLKEDEAGFVRCPDAQAHIFFQGLVIARRGKKDGQDDANKAAPGELGNNDVLWYLRIALQMKDDDVVAALKKASVDVSASEINALFRKKGHKNYMPCGDQFLRNFLAGITATYR